MDIAISRGDSLRVVVTVMDGAAPMDLTGATLTAGATFGAVRADPAVTVTDAAAGVARLDWAAGALGEGYWTAALRVTVGGEALTVWAGRIAVGPSPIAAA